LLQLVKTCKKKIEGCFGPVNKKIEDVNRLLTESSGWLDVTQLNGMLTAIN
jgi:hypothetical protein